MPTVSITVNVAEFSAKMQNVAREQIPFAAALALTQCGNDAVTASKASLSSKFIIRNNRTAAGFRTDRATKRNLVATVRHLDQFMALQEFGGEKTPLAQKDVAIPVGARPTPTALTPQSKWPGHLARHFYITKGGNLLEFQRVGRRSKGKRGKRHVDRRSGPRPLDPNVRLMYVLKTGVHVRPRLGLVEQCRDTLAKNFGPNFTTSMEFAMRTAK